MARSPTSLTRRGFFGQAAVAPVAGLVPAIVRPRQAWIVVALGWEYNDEFTFPEGQYPQSRLFYDRGEADAECERLCAAFFSEQTPEEFELDWSVYGPERASELGFDESSVTWDEVRALGFPDPYFVLELSTPEVKTP